MAWGNRSNSHKGDRRRRCTNCGLAGASDAKNVRNPMIYEFGPFRLDSRQRVLLRHNEAVPLTPKVFDILLCAGRETADNS